MKQKQRELAQAAQEGVGDLHGHRHRARDRDQRVALPIHDRAAREGGGLGGDTDQVAGLLDAESDVRLGELRRDRDPPRLAGPGEDEIERAAAAGANRLRERSKAADRPSVDQILRETRLPALRATCCVELSSRFFGAVFVNIIFELGFDHCTNGDKP